MCLGERRELPQRGRKRIFGIFWSRRTALYHKKMHFFCHTFSVRQLHVVNNSPSDQNVWPPLEMSSSSSGGLSLSNLLHLPAVGSLGKLNTSLAGWCYGGVGGCVHSYQTVWWQVILCDLIWQVTLRSCAMGSLKEPDTTFFLSFVAFLCLLVYQASCSSAASSLT